MRRASNGKIKACWATARLMAQIIRQERVDLLPFGGFLAFVAILAGDAVAWVGGATDCVWLAPLGEWDRTARMLWIGLPLALALASAGLAPSWRRAARATRDRSAASRDAPRRER